jgi:hypothetical protein
LEKTMQQHAHGGGGNRRPAPPAGS